MDRSKSFGRKRIRSHATDRLILRSMIGTSEKRRTTSMAIESSLNYSGIDISSRTVRNRPVESRLDSNTAAKKQFLHNVNVNKRLERAPKYQNLTEKDWENVIWSHEASFTIFEGKVRDVLADVKEKDYIQIVHRKMSNTEEGRS